MLRCGGEHNVTGYMVCKAWGSKRRKTTDAPEENDTRVTTFQRDGDKRIKDTKWSVFAHCGESDYSPYNCHSNGTALPQYEGMQASIGASCPSDVPPIWTAFAFVDVAAVHVE